MLHGFWICHPDPLTRGFLPNCPALDFPEPFALPPLIPESCVLLPVQHARGAETEKDCDCRQSLGRYEITLSLLLLPVVCLTGICHPVGKSSLTVRFVEHHFVESYYPTIENTFSRIIKYNGQDYATEIVDTAGQVCPSSSLQCKMWPY